MVFPTRRSGDAHLRADRFVQFFHPSLREKFLIRASNFAAFGQKEQTRGETVEPVRRRELLVTGGAAKADGDGLGDVGGAGHRRQERRLPHYHKILVLEDGIYLEGDAALGCGDTVKEDVRAWGYEILWPECGPVTQNDLSRRKPSAERVFVILGVAVPLLADHLF